MRSLGSVFKPYDVRGVVPTELDAEAYRAIGASFAAYAGAGRIVVGRDMRPSGTELAAAFVDGARSQGVDVLDLGLASTDLVYFASGVLDAPGAMFTASHNPPEYNGIKFCLERAKPISLDTGLAEIRDTAQQGGPTPAASTGSYERRDMLADFAGHVRGFAGDDLRPLRVIADCANGMGGLVAPAVFSDLPFELDLLYPELDGTFPNHPADPINPDNLKDLRRRIVETSADVGLAFDGDADRVFLVDDQAEPVSGSTTTAMVAAALLDQNGAAPVIYNLICSKAVPEVIREHGGTPIRSRVGHSYIKATMAENDALFGGEHSGHYYFADNFRADSGIIAAMVVLGMLCRSGVPLSEMRRPYERYAASGEINTRVADPVATVSRIEARFAGQAGYSIDRLDGLTVDAGDWWFNVRPSNTEPLLRLNLEAPDREACEARTAEIVSLIKEYG